MKDPAEWEENDLVELIKAQAEESITREFKRGQVLEDLEDRQRAEKRKDEMSIDVSAFANRIGGVIIYGIDAEDKPPHQACALSPIDPLKCSKERLEQIINSRIKPRIPGLEIRPITVSSACPSRVVYVIKIPRSHTVHQASDKRYYRRGNFTNEIMDDDEIRQTMNRETKPTYRVQLTATLIGTDLLFVAGSVQNTSVMVGRDVSTVLLIPKEFSSGRGVRPGNEIADFQGGIIDDVTYVRILNDRGLLSQLSPFATTEIIFDTAVKIPDPRPPKFESLFPTIVLVYDQLGQAHQAEFWISLFSPIGQVVRGWEKGRDESL